MKLSRKKKWFEPLEFLDAPFGTSVGASVGLFVGPFVGGGVVFVSWVVFENIQYASIRI